MARIRPAVPADALAVASVHVASWQVGYAHIFDQAFLAALDPSERARRYTFGLDDVTAPFTQVALVEESIVGFVTTSVCRDEDLEDAGEIQALYVDPAHWGRGIGRVLLHAGTERIVAQGFATAALWVLVDNLRAKQLYVAEGWSFDGSVRVEDPWGVTATVERLVRSLR